MTDYFGEKRANFLRPARLLINLRDLRRDGREAEGTGLLNRHRWKRLSRVRIPLSPFNSHLPSAISRQLADGRRLMADGFLYYK